jgi:TPP-dependent pyruvate/acetoin dehydrogenase alpha subunit
VEQTGTLDFAEAYRRMYLIRRVETEIARRYHPDPDNPGDSPMRCPVHLADGAEALAVGVAMAVSADTHVWVTHRNHHVYLAFGGDLDAMVAELYGKATGCSGGWGGSMYLHDKAAGVMGGSAIVGSAVSMAVGSAWAAKLQGSERLTVAWAGDAVVETGQFWEAWNFARLHELRLLFVIENNEFSTATNRLQRHGMRPPAVSSVNGANGEAVFGRVAGISAFPFLLWADVPRYREHVGPGFDDWREGERPDARGLYGYDDPLPQLARVIFENMDSGVMAVIEPEINARVDEAFEKAEAAPWPE